MPKFEFSLYREIFENRSFRLYWPGFTLSFVGDTMTRVAFTWYVYELTNSAGALAVLTLVYLGPVVIGGLFAGVLLDKFGSRQVMFVDNVFRGAVVLMIPILHWLDKLVLWHVYVVAGIYGLLMMITAAGGPSLVPSIVSKKHLETANALEVMGLTVGSVIGAPIAGFLISRIGAVNIILIDSLTYFLFAASLAGVRLMPKKYPKVEKEKSDVVNKHNLKDAVQLLGTNKVLLSTTLMYAIGNLSYGMMFVWLPIYSSQVPGGGSSLYGILLGAISVGQVLGAVLVGGISFSITLGMAIIVANILAGMVLLVPLLGSMSSLLVGLSLGFYGLFDGPLTAWAQTLRMKIIPEQMRGRTFSLLRTIMYGAQPAGGALAGIIMPLFSITTIVGLSAILLIIPGLAGIGVSQLREAE